MTLDQLRTILAEHRAEMEACGVTSVSVFGSTARGEARPDSDVDLLVDLREPIGLIALAGLQIDLSEWLGCPVDLVTRRGLHPALRDRVLAEAVRAA